MGRNKRKTVFGNKKGKKRARTHKTIDDDEDDMKLNGPVSSKLKFNNKKNVGLTDVLKSLMAKYSDENDVEDEYDFCDNVKFDNEYKNKLGGSNDGMRGVVKIFVTSIQNHHRRPWQMCAQISSCGSGCLLTERRILTNAHVVSFGTTITLMKHGDPQRYLCKVVAFGHEYDLALLEAVEDVDLFWSNVTPLEIGDLPELRERINVIGYPLAGVNTASITEGVVSRFVTNIYTHSEKFSFMSIQIDAAINPGNSGGPAISDGKLVGIAFEAQEETQGIGFLIPTTIIKHFLKHIATYGKVKVFVHWDFIRMDVKIKCCISI